MEFSLDDAHINSENGFSGSSSNGGFGFILGVLEEEDEEKDDCGKWHTFIDFSLKIC